MTSCSCKQRTSAGRPAPHLQLPPRQLCLHDGGDRLTAVLLLSCTSAETDPQQLFVGMFPRVISNVGAGICSPESVKMFAVKLFRVFRRAHAAGAASKPQSHQSAHIRRQGRTLTVVASSPWGAWGESWFQNMLAYLAFMLRGAAVLGFTHVTLIGFSCCCHGNQLLSSLYRLVMVSRTC